MKNIIKIVLLIIAIFGIARTDSFAQKVWHDDKKPEYKGDTSIVEIDGKFYKKIIGVYYSEVSEALLQEEFRAAKEQIRNQRQDLRRDMQEKENALEQLELELEMKRNFFKTARKDLRIAAKDADELDTFRSEINAAKQQEVENRKLLIQGAIIANPRKPK